MELSRIKIIACLFVAFIFVGATYGQSVVISKTNKPTIGKLNPSYKKISGYIFYKNLPLSKVSINVKNTTYGTKSNSKGYFAINAKVGTILKFSYLGMQPIEVIVEDVTSTLNIDMKTVNNELDEVVLNNKFEKIKAGYSALNIPLRMPTFYGSINPLAGSIKYIRGENLNLAAPDLFSAIVYRIPSLRPTNFINVSSNILWDIDGFITTNPPYIDVNEVIDIAVLRSFSDLVLYGSEGRNGVIVVRTKRAYFDVTNPYAEHNPYTNKNRYNDDALPLVKSDLSVPASLNFLTNAPNSKQAFDDFNAQANKFKNKPSYFIDAANYFKTKYNDTRFATEILSELNKLYANNPEILKALAYQYEKLKLPIKALNTYKQIIKLRPNYAQSFRDLANAYTNVGDFSNAWKYYMNYLFRGHKLGNTDIGKIMYAEMEYLYTNYKNKANISESFELQNGKKFEKDIRVVFEWNTSNAEFNLEFVNPQKQSYVFRHTLYDDNTLINKEKKIGYSSREFYIENLKRGQWLVNLKYLGNLTDNPTYMKVTTYYNWERPNQTKKTIILELNKKNIKYNLLKFNSKKNSI